MKKDHFEMILNSSVNNYIDSYFDISVYPDDPHDFSGGFERKMDKLIKKQRRIFFPVFKTGFRKTAIIAVTVVIMMFSAVMGVGAWRRAFFMFITRPFAGHTDVETASDGSAPAEIEHICKPEYIPAGFRLAESSGSKESCLTSIYTGDDGSFDFTQWIKPVYDTSVNTEGQDMEPLNINGCEGFAVDMGDKGGCLITWDNGDYILQISGTIDKSTALKIACSVN